jgi:hypothetical protein
MCIKVVSFLINVIELYNPTAEFGFLFEVRKLLSNDVIIG